jgi:hypothetical protein
VKSLSFSPLLSNLVLFSLIHSIDQVCVVLSEIAGSPIHPLLGALKKSTEKKYNRVVMVQKDSKKQKYYVNRQSQS